MARKYENPLTACMVTQILDTDYFDWEENGLKLIEEYNNSDNEEEKMNIKREIHKFICLKLINAGAIIKESHFIVHNKDFRKVWSEAVMGYVDELKAPHFHQVIVFEERKFNINQIAEIIGIEPQYIEKPKRGSYAVDNMIAYTIHAKDADKYQYDPKEVDTLYSKGVKNSRNFIEIYNEKKQEWEAGRVVKTQKKAKKDAPALKDMILRGEITKNQILLTDEYYRVYAENPNLIDEAFNTYGQMRAAHAVESLKNGDFQKRFYFITGKSGSGKTKCATELINHIVEKQKEINNEEWRVYNAASANSLDDYAGEEIILMDDLRGSAMTATEWLLLLDPYNANPAKARYRNKPAIASRAIILTSSVDPMKFFYYVRQKGDVDEAMDQFIRRVQMLVEVIDIDALDELQGDRKYKLKEVVKELEPKTTEIDEYSRFEHSYDFKDDKKFYNQDELNNIVSEQVQAKPNENVDISTKGVSEEELNLKRKQKDFQKNKIDKYNKNQKRIRAMTSEDLERLQNQQQDDFFEDDGTNSIY